MQLFKAWADEAPANAAQEAMSFHTLFDKHLARVAKYVPATDDCRSRLSRQSATEYLTRKRTRNHPWWALCYFALQLYEDQEAAPNALRYFAGEYAKRLEWPTPSTPPPVGTRPVDPQDGAKMIKSLQARLAEHVEQGAQADLAEMAGAADQLATLLFGRLKQTPGDDSSLVLDEDTTQTAEHLCDLAHVLITRVDAAERREVTDDIRRNCAEVFDAAIHAHRRLARSPGREANELGRLGMLRVRDMNITDPIRSNVERVFMRYHGEHSGALLRARGKTQLRAELAAARRLVSGLAELKKNAPEGALSVVRLDGQRPARDDVVDVDRLVGVACRVACAVAVDPAPTKAVTDLRRDLVNLFPRGHERHDVRWLLTLAAGSNKAVLGASETLRVARIRGVGEYLLARMFVAASASDEAAVDIQYRSRYRLFQPPDKDLLRRVARTDEDLRPDESEAEFLARLREQRRILILQRAAGLYGRSLVWLRESGSAGQLRSRAGEELDAVRAVLPPRQRDPKSVVHALSGLRHRLEEMTIDGFLWADIDAWTNMNEGKAAFSARRLSAVLEQTQRYLSQPELGVVADT